jgi:hypothetical protein
MHGKKDLKKAGKISKKSAKKHQKTGVFLRCFISP